MIRYIGESLWGTATVVCLVLCGLWLSYCGGFVQVRRFGRAVRVSVGRLFQRSHTPGATSPLEAVCTALAGTVGTGNIAGVAVALTLGGPGAVFWMWISAFIGMGTKYAEIYFAVKYREKRGGEYVGGPMYYIKNGLGPRAYPLAALFSAAGALASFGIGNMMQVGSVLTVSGTQGPVPAPLICAGAGALVFLTCRGGAQGRGRAAAFIVPVMALLYSAGALSVIFLNIHRLPAAFRSILTGALSPMSAAGGAAGFGISRALSAGFRRGLFSNEAGLGSSPIAYAGSRTDSPEEQALMGVFEVFADTIVICTLTALMVLTSGVELRYGMAGGAEYCAAALATVFGKNASRLFMTAAMALFAFSSIVSWSLYGERCVQFLAGERWSARYRALFAAWTVVPAFVPFDTVVGISDILNFFMLLPNITALTLLSGKLKSQNWVFFDKKRSNNDRRPGGTIFPAVSRHGAERKR